MKILYYTLTDRPIVVTDRTCHTTVLEDVPGVFFADETIESFAVTLRQALATEMTYDRKKVQTDSRQRYQRVYDDVLD